MEKSRKWNKRNINKLFFIDNKHGWAITENSCLKYNGEKWTFVQGLGDDKILSIYGNDTNNVWMRTNQKVFKWNGNQFILILNKLVYDFYNLHFIDNNTGWGFWIDCSPMAYIQQSPCPTKIFYYDGKRWLAQESPETAKLYSIDFFDKENGWAVGGNGSIFRLSFKNQK
jgi:hypothetical protein